MTTKLKRPSQIHSDDFYASLQPGQTVHFGLHSLSYGEGLGQYVRCEVTEARYLKPVALVGVWENPVEAHSNRYAKMIVDGETMRPHASNIYECNPGGREAPQNLPDVPIVVPEMTAEDKEAAQLWKTVGFVQRRLEGARGNPTAALEDVYEVIGTALRRKEP
jgi:hypothetical protein